MDLFLLLEWASVLFNLLFLLLLIPQKVWAWPMGIIGSLLGIVLLLHARLYSEAILYLFYVIIGIYGWVSWYRPAYLGNTKAITERDPLFHFKWVLICITFAIGLGYFFKTRTDAQKPFLDAFTTIFSFFASYLEALKVLSAWIYWFVINTFSIWLYSVRGMEVYPFLAAFYSVMCVVGYLRWKKQMT